LFQHIDEIREEASRALRRIAWKSGRGSPVHASSQLMWRELERAASLWLVRGDFPQAESVLREGLDALVRLRQLLGSSGPWSRLLRRLRPPVCGSPDERLAF